MTENRAENRAIVNYFFNGYLFLISTISYWPFIILSNLPMQIKETVHSLLTIFVFSYLMLPIILFIFKKKSIVNKNSSITLILDKYIKRYSKKIFWLGIALSAICIFIINPLTMIIKNPTEDFVSVIFPEIIFAPFIVLMFVAIIFFYKITHKLAEIMLRINNPENKDIKNT
jgi:hypothetical protein